MAREVLWKSGKEGGRENSTFLEMSRGIGRCFLAKMKFFSTLSRGSDQRAGLMC